MQKIIYQIKKKFVSHSNEKQIKRLFFFSNPKRNKRNGIELN